MDKREYIGNNLTDNEYYIALGKRLRELRRLRRYSQEALARGIGVTRNSVAGWEGGQPITAINLHRVAVFLNVGVGNMIPCGIPAPKSYNHVESADVTV